MRSLFLEETLDPEVHTTYVVLDDSTLGLFICWGVGMRIGKLKGVYFALDEEMNLVKIGGSSDIMKRLYGVAHAGRYPLVILGMIPTSEDTCEAPSAPWRELERELHIEFQGYRERKEWYYFGGDLKSFLKEQLFTYQFYKGKAKVKHDKKLAEIFEVTAKS